MLEDVKEVIISGISKKEKQCTGQKFENTNGEIRDRKSRKDRQHKAKKKYQNGNQKRNSKNMTDKATDKATRTPLKTRDLLSYYASIKPIFNNARI